MFFPLILHIDDSVATEKQQEIAKTFVREIQYLNVSRELDRSRIEMDPKIVLVYGIMDAASHMPIEKVDPTNIQVKSLLDFVKQ